MQNVKVKGQSTRKIEWKPKDGWTDGRTEAIAYPPVLMRSVINDFCQLIFTVQVLAAISKGMRVSKIRPQQNPSLVPKWECWLIHCIMAIQIR